MIASCFFCFFLLGISKKEVSGIPTKSNCKIIKMCENGSRFFCRILLNTVCFCFRNLSGSISMPPNQLLWPFFRPRSEELKVDPAPRPGPCLKNGGVVRAEETLGGEFGGLAGCD